MTFKQRLRFAIVAYKNAHRVLNGLPIAIEATCASPAALQEALQYVRVTYVTFEGKEVKKKLSLI